MLLEDGACEQLLMRQHLELCSDLVESDIVAERGNFLGWELSVSNRGWCAILTIRTSGT
jgi:hypothetical protein